MAEELTGKGLELYRAWRNKLPVGQDFVDEVTFQRYFINGSPEQMAEYMLSMGMVKGEAAYNGMIKAFKEIKHDGPMKYGQDLFAKFKSNIEGLSAEVDRAGGIKEWLAAKAEKNKNDLPGYGGAVLGAVVGYGLLSELFGNIGTIGKIIIGGVTALIGFFAAMKLTGGGIELEKKLNEKSGPAPLPPAIVPDPFTPPISFNDIEKPARELKTNFQMPEGIQLPTLQSTVAVTTADNGLKSPPASLPVAERQAQQAPQIQA